MSGSIAAQEVPQRQLLIEATMTAVAEHGFSNLTLSKIAGEAGLTAGSVNFHFSSKEALLLETLKYVSTEFGDAVLRASEQPRAADRLVAIVEAALSDVVTEFRKVAVWYAFSSEVNGRQEYHDVCGERDRNYARYIEDACRELIDEAGRSNQLNAPAIAMALRGMIDEVWQEVLFVGENYDRDAGRDQCFAFLASIFPWAYSMPESRGLQKETTSDLTLTLPSWIYHSEEFLELEKERIFLSSWQLACHESDLKCAGQYVTYNLFNERAFVIRTADGDIRAFHNVCRHRAHLLLEGEEGLCEGRIVCPYHGWTYEQTGERVAIGFPDSFRQHDSSDYGLVAIECEVYQSFVFIRFRSGGPSVAERMAPVAEEFAGYQLQDRVSAGGDFWQVEVNVDWKNVIENYMEDYHFFMGHKGLSGLMKDEYDREPFDTDLVRLSHEMRDKPRSGWSIENYHKLLPDLDYLPESSRRRWTYFVLFPNTFFDLYPDRIDFYQVLPTSAGKAVLRGRSYDIEDDGRLMRVVRWLNERINWRVQEEDNTLTESVQQGLGSSSYVAGILSDKEVLLKHFGEYIRRNIPEAESTTPVKRISR